MQIAYQFQCSQNRINMPSLAWRVPLGCQADLRCHSELELVIGNLQEGQQLSNEDLDIRLVDQSIRQLQGTSSNRDIPVA